MELTMQIEKSIKSEWMVKLLYDDCLLFSANKSTQTAAVAYSHCTPIFNRALYGHKIVFYDCTKNNFVGDKEVPRIKDECAIVGIEYCNLCEVERFLIDMVATVNSNPELLTKFTVKYWSSEKDLLAVPITGRFLAVHEFVANIR